MNDPIVQTVTFDVPPAKVYAALTQADQHAAYTGGKSSIDARPGGAFSGHDGQIVGVNIELVPGQRIVQAWRVTAWPPGLYTVVRYDLEPEGSGTKLTLTHSGTPEGGREMLAQGWEQRYWEPMKAYFAG